VMTYEMLAGRPPFEGPMKVLAGPPTPIRQLRPDVTGPLQIILDGCLAAAPEQRFDSAADVVRILGGRTPSSGGLRTASVPVQPRRLKRRWVATGIVALGTAAVAWLASTGRFSRVPAPALHVDSGMVLVAAGDYLIGSDSGPPAAYFRPAHRVSLGAFGLDQFEITVGQYQAYLDSMKVTAPWDPDSLPDSGVAVTRVTYRDAVAYCRWRHPEGGRLPTEEEWEAAARGAAGRLYPWSDGSRADRANLASSGRGTPTAPGTFSGGATPEGVHDLIGNVWEWTSSSLRPYAGGSSIPDSMSKHRVIRGGAFNTTDSIATSWWRTPVPEGAAPGQLNATGFRCAMSARAPAQVVDGRG